MNTPDFDLSKPGFNLVNARMCADISALAYDQNTIANPLNHILILDQGPVNVIAFRGTKSIEDFITDAQVWMVNDILFGEIHHGFSLAFNSTREALYEAVAKLDRKKPFIVTGHSLGGNQAHLCGIWLVKQMGITPADVITYGEPRGGSASFRALSEQCLPGLHHRVVNQEDVVPRIPNLFARYRHAGELQFIPSIDHKLHRQPALWMMALSDVFGLWREWSTAKKIALLEDHRIARYQSALAEASA